MRNGHPSAPAAASNRLESRWSVPRYQQAFIEFDHPVGKRRRLTVLDVSPAGVCFALPFYGLAGIETSSTLAEVVVRVGACEIEGELVVSHVTRESDQRVLCGGRFYPATALDQLQLQRVLVGLQSNHPI